MSIKPTPIFLLNSVIDLRMRKDLERLQRETDHHGGGIEADALSAPPLITPLTAPPARPLAIDDQHEKDKVQSNARQHRPCDEFEIQRHLRGGTHACVTGSPRGFGASGERVGRRKVTKGRKLKARIESENRRIGWRILPLRDGNAEDP